MGSEHDWIRKNSVSPFFGELSVKVGDENRPFLKRAVNKTQSQSEAVTTENRLLYKLMSFKVINRLKDQLLLFCRFSLSTIAKLALFVYL